MGDAFSDDTYKGQCLSQEEKHFFSRCCMQIVLFVAMLTFAPVL